MSKLHGAKMKRSETDVNWMLTWAVFYSCLLCSLAFVRVLPLPVISIDNLFWFRLTRVGELSFFSRNHCFETKPVFYSNFGVFTLRANCLEFGGESSDIRLQKSWSKLPHMMVSMLIIVNMFRSGFAGHEHSFYSNMIET